MVDSSGSEVDDEDQVEVDEDDDLEIVTVTSLFDDAKFDSVPAMLDYVQKNFDFDLASVQHRLGEESFHLPLH